MRILKRILGKILYAVAKMISITMDALINLIETIVTFVRNIARGFLALISMGGCLLFLLLAVTGILADPRVYWIIFFLVLFPILGTKFISYLNYQRHIITDFLFDRANFLIDGTAYRFKSFGEYKDAYKKAEEEKKRREQQRRSAEQQRTWEKSFWQWSKYQNFQRGHSSYDGQGNYGHNYVNPSVDFKTKYEKSCDILGVGYDADKHQIRIAYRKKAKEYHPDLNKSPNATKMFQQINDAHEFLSDANIEEYKQQ